MESKKLKTQPQRWEELPKDIVLAIYTRLDVYDLIVGAPLCCTSWYQFSKDPSLWRVADLRVPLVLKPVEPNPLLELFGIELPVPLVIKGKPVEPNQLLHFFVARGADLLNSITFPHDATVDDFLFVADRCRGLKHFKFDTTILEPADRHKICIAISKLKELEGMNVHESFISYDLTLQQIGECCPRFTKLKLYDGPSEDTASLIVTSLPKLKYLDVSVNNVHRKALLVILKGCHELEYLDISDCGKVYHKDEILEYGDRLKDFKFLEEEDEWCPLCEREWQAEGSGSEFSYKWPCEHTKDTGISDYLTGTEEIVSEADLFAEYESDEYEGP